MVKIERLPVGLAEAEELRGELVRLRKAGKKVAAVLLSGGGELVLHRHRRGPNLGLAAVLPRRERPDGERHLPRRHDAEAGHQVGRRPRGPVQGRARLAHPGEMSREQRESLDTFLDAEMRPLRRAGLRRASAFAPSDSAQGARGGAPAAAPGRPREAGRRRGGPRAARPGRYGAGARGRSIGALPLHSRAPVGRASPHRGGAGAGRIACRAEPERPAGLLPLGRLGDHPAGAARRRERIRGSPPSWSAWTAAGATRARLRRHYRSVLRRDAEARGGDHGGRRCARAATTRRWGRTWVLAEPTTLTGSIGVFVLKPGFEGLGEEAGDQRGDAEARTALRHPRPLQARGRLAEQAAAQRWVDAFYETSWKRSPGAGG